MEFGTAVHDSDFGRAILFLESRGASVDTDGMWQVRTRFCFVENKLMYFVSVFVCICTQKQLSNKLSTFGFNEFSNKSIIISIDNLFLTIVLYMIVNKVILTTILCREPNVAVY